MKLNQQITIPRIIGLILIVLAVVFYPRGIAQSVLLAIVGLILLLTAKEHSRKQFKRLIESFKLKKDFAQAMFYDAMFWVALVLLSLALWKILMSAAGPLQGIQLGSPEALNNLQQYNTVIASFFKTAIIALIAFWLIATIAYGISRSLIWLSLLGKPLHTPFFLRFGLLNLIWYTVWIALITFFLVALKPAAGAYVLMVLVLLYTHLTTALHYSYTKARAFGKSIRDAFATGIGKIASFIHPYCYIFIIYVLLSQILRFAGGKMMVAAAFIILFVFMAWYRTYMRNILRQIS